MKTLSPRIIKKLAKELSLSEKTVQNKIYSLSKSYPRATLNARAFVYAEKNGLNIYKFLDKEDKLTLPSGGSQIATNLPKQTGLRVLVQTDKEPAHWYNNFWVQLIITFLGTGIIAGTVAQILGIYFAKLLGITSN